jgi:hypothetical protein
LDTPNPNLYDFVVAHLGSIGLVLDMIGVSILFFVVVTVGEQVVRIDEEEERLRLRTKRIKETYLKIGFGLIFLGFLFQLLSNELKNKPQTGDLKENGTVRAAKAEKAKDYSKIIVGNWYQNKWVLYHTLIFSSSTVFVDNNIDTVFTLNYVVSGDTLITWMQNPSDKTKNRIIELTKDTLVLDRLRGVETPVRYSRRKRL